MKLNVDVINARINWAMTLQYPSWTLLLYSPPPACSYPISSNWKWKKTQIENPFFGWTVANVFLSFHWPSVGCYFKHKENVIFCLHFWHHPHGGGGLESWGIWQYQMGTTGLTWAPFIRDKNKNNQENSIITKKKNKEKWWKPVEFGVWHSPLPTIRGPPAISSTFVFLTPVVFILEWVLSVGELGHR